MKKFKSSEYLYDINLKDIIHKPYSKVLLIKIISAENLLKKLVREENMEDSQRMKEVLKAIDHNRELLLEVGYSIYDVKNMLEKERVNHED